MDAGLEVALAAVQLDEPNRGYSIVWLEQANSFVGQTCDAPAKEGEPLAQVDLNWGQKGEDAERAQAPSRGLRLARAGRRQLAFA